MNGDGKPVDGSHETDGRSCAESEAWLPTLEEAQAWDLFNLDTLPGVDGDEPWPWDLPTAA